MQQMKNKLLREIRGYAHWDESFSNLWLKVSGDTCSEVSKSVSQILYIVEDQLKEENK